MAAERPRQRRPLNAALDPLERQRLGAPLFYIGLVIAVAGFLGDKAENLPWILRLIAPSHVLASQGLDILLSKGVFRPGETGFTELERIFRKEADAKGVGPQLDFHAVQKFVRKTAMLALGEQRAGEVVPFEVHLFGGGKVDWDMAGLRERTEQIKRSSLPRFSAVVFAIGLAVTVAGRIIEAKAKGSNQALEPAAPTPSE